MSLDLSPEPDGKGGHHNRTEAPVPQGFDWDRDYEELLSKVSPSSNQSDEMIRTASVALFPKRVFVPGLIVPIAVCGLLISALAVAKFGPALLTKPTLSQFVIGLSAPLPTKLTVLPMQLQVYDHAQYQRFSQGLRQMSAKDLLEYETRLRRDITTASGFMAPYHLDALIVLEAELALRGLSPPN